MATLSPHKSTLFSDLTQPLFDTGIKARGSLSKKAEPLLVQNSDRATMYVCGVTVYDHCHLGHARSACAFDVIARHLRTKVGQLVFARNITDIDDKIIARAQKNGEDWKSLALRMEKSMREDFSSLGCAAPDIEPRATDHIPEMIQHIDALMQMGLAYVDAGGSVWRDGTHWDGVGKVSGRKIEDLVKGARGAAHPGKKSDRDFVLWKAAKPGEPSWSSPWGEGRPGWHIECSAMSRKSLGDSLDLHGGGEDLKFPHHECECAQSEPVTGQPLARAWLHNGFVVLPKNEGKGFEEMHKSSGNALNIKGLLAIHPGEAIRAWALSAHYRQPLPYSAESLDYARARAWRWAIAKEAAIAMGADPKSPCDPAVTTALDTDFNTPQAFSHLDALSKAMKDKPSLETAGALLGSLAALGLGFTPAAELAPSGTAAKADQKEQTNPELARLMQQRASAREAKDWAKADEIRDLIKHMGFEINDAPSSKTPKR